MDCERLDTWLPRPALRTHHRHPADADPDGLWDAAREIRVCDVGALGRIVRWRIPGTPAGIAFDSLFRRYPFTVLEEGERHLVSGLAGRIWTLRRDYPRLDGPDDFRDWDARGTVRVLFAHWVEPGKDGEAWIVSEARVAPTDGIARLRLRALWAIVARFERLVGPQALRVAARRAEGS
ncbi:MAG TPA: hypothetical protein VNT32_03370 [Thermoleophilaceae bacterium]|nr:hypothetical protein [Thermoleophilaceae bacterium]